MGIIYYQLMGRKWASHHLGMITLAAYFIVPTVYMKTRPAPAAAVGNTPPISASSGDEEDFIKNFLAEAAQEKAKH